MYKDAVPEEEEVFEDYPVIVADWLKRYVWTCKRIAREEGNLDEAEKKRLKKLKKAAKKIKKNEGPLPDLSHLLPESILKQYEYRRKLYKRLRKDVEG